MTKTLSGRQKKIDPSRGGTWGIVGGSFNPVHFGHLIMAESVMHSLAADGMIFVPARRHPFKTNHELAPYRHRLKMLRIALAGNGRFVLDQSPAGVAYTIDLIDFLRRRFPTAAFILVVGSDIVGEFESWYKHEEIERSVRVAVAVRPGHEESLGAVEALRKAERVLIPQYDISSSEIRERIRHQMSIKYLVPEGVEEYISEQRLYVA